MFPMFTMPSHRPSASSIGKAIGRSAAKSVITDGGMASTFDACMTIAFTKAVTDYFEEFTDRIAAHDPADPRVPKLRAKIAEDRAKVAGLERERALQKRRRYRRAALKEALVAGPLAIAAMVAIGLFIHGPVMDVARAQHRIWHHDEPPTAPALPPHPRGY